MKDSLRPDGGGGRQLPNTRDQYGRYYGNLAATLLEYCPAAADSRLRKHREESTRRMKTGR